MAESLLATRVSLLGRLRDSADQAAWGEFVDRYGPHILRWARHYGLQASDAQDVTQTVLLRLAERLRSFEYDPGRSFRGYLKTLTRYAWQDCQIARRRYVTDTPDNGEPGMLDQLEAPDDLATRLASEYDLEIFEAARFKVRLRVEPRTWSAFELTTFEQLDGAEVARRLGMQVGTVYKARSKVLAMLKDEIRALDPEVDVASAARGARASGRA